jgi:hypothetical protein
MNSYDVPVSVCTSFLVNNHCCLGGVSFTARVLRYYFAIGNPGVFSVVLADSHGIPFHVPHATRVGKLVMLSATGLSPSRIRCTTPLLRLAARRLYCSPTTPLN